MNIVIPDGKRLWDGTKNFFAGLGLVPTLLLVVVVVALALFAFQGIWTSIGNWNTQRQIDNLKAEADQLRIERDAAVAEKEQYKGAAAAYQEQAKTVQNELTELFNVRPELQKQITVASNRVDEIRKKPPVPVTNDMRDRINAVGATLDELYP